MWLSRVYGGCRKKKKSQTQSRKKNWKQVSQLDNRKTIERINKTKVGFVRRLIKLNFSQTDHENKTKQNKKRGRFKLLK